MVNKENFKENNKLNKLVEKVNKSEISSIREIVIRLITVTNDPKFSAKDLKNIIEKDPPLAARLLRLVNSAYYGLSRRISEIQEAIIRIGFVDVIELALSQKVCELFKKGSDFDGYSRTALWEHSVSVALCSKSIYMKEFRETGENAYTAGLLQNIGIIVEDQFLQNKFKDALINSGKNKCNLQFAEKNILGFDHTDIGRTIADNWCFPDELVIAIGNHHEPDVDDVNFKKITLTSYISDYICQRNDMGYCDAPYENKSLFTKCLKELNIQEKAMNLIVEDVQKEIQKMKECGWFQNEK